MICIRIFLLAMLATNTGSAAVAETSEPASGGVSVFIDLIEEMIAKEPTNSYWRDRSHRLRASPAQYYWLGPGSPWRNYMDRQFTQGLSPPLVRRLREFQRHGRCDQVLELEISGLLARYPELQPALARQSIRDNLATEIIPQFSIAYQHCSAHRTVMERSRELEFLFKPKQDDLSSIQRESTLDVLWYDVIKSDYILPLQIYGEQFIALMTLYRLALCQRYPPAIRDVDFLESRNWSRQFSYHQLIWFFQIAEVAGVELIYLPRIIDSLPIDDPPPNGGRITDPDAQLAKIAAFCRANSLLDYY